MSKKTKPVAVMCFSSGTGGMERSAVRLAETLDKVADVILFCKQGSFTEGLYNEGAYSFKCEQLRFTSRIFSLSMMFSVGTTKSRPKRDFIHNLVYSCVNHHVAISEHLGRNVKEIVPIDDRVDYRIIRPSFNFESEQLSSNNNVGKEIVKIVHVGRIADCKGQIDAVLACGKLYNEGIGFMLKFVGGDDGGEYLQKRKSLKD